VPAGHRLVIQHVGSSSVIFQSTPQQNVQVTVTVSDGGVTSFFVPFSQQSVAFDQIVQLYVDAGDSALVTVAADNETDFPLEGILTLTGYLLDCKAAPCAAIAK
jgi:hypothetical protein